ncbi:hypothetical protein ARMGADRAFT_1091098 [Armillaria gallica]|uniref:Uncharacterized protein n=1 Tax=Armillaria gallica TaxID=47427 RepID=A0A2H3CQW1_ARMGA|nr:hypothetical protein ARMGADRAFT_1091098 [Armillaria gallica]
MSKDLNSSKLLSISHHFTYFHIQPMNFEAHIHSQAGLHLLVSPLQSLDISSLRMRRHRNHYDVLTTVIVEIWGITICVEVWLELAGRREEAMSWGIRKSEACSTWLNLQAFTLMMHRHCKVPVLYGWGDDPLLR